MKARSTFVLSSYQVYHLIFGNGFKTNFAYKNSSWIVYLIMQVLFVVLINKVQVLHLVYNTICFKHVESRAEA